MSKLRLRCKLWLEIDGHPLLGDGRVRLLEAIAANGSIKAASRQLEIPYRKVWAQLKEMEELAPFPILKRAKGGAGGGGTELTPQAGQLLECFAEINRTVNEKLADLRQCDIHLKSTEPTAVRHQVAE